MVMNYRLVGFCTHRGGVLTSSKEVCSMPLQITMLATSDRLRHLRVAIASLTH